MGYSKIHAVQTAIHEAINSIKIPARLHTISSQFFFKNTRKYKRIIILKQTKFDTKKGVSLRSYHSITIHLYVLRFASIFFVYVRTVAWKILLFNNSEGRQCSLLSPLAAKLQKRVELSTVARRDVYLAADWLGWFCQML